MKEQDVITPTYDRYGRMNYHPDYHPNQWRPWTTTDQQYLIDYYEALGPDQISFDLGRTIHTIMTRAYELRKNGEMPKPKRRVRHRRVRLEVGDA